MATGEAAPVTEPAETAPVDSADLPETVTAAPPAGVAPPASTEATRETPPPTGPHGPAPTQPAPTQPTPPPTAPREPAAGRGGRRWVAWLVGAAAVAVLAVLGVTLLGGGGGDEGIKFVPFTEAKSFTVDVPKGWVPPAPGAVERKLPTATATKLVSPNEDGVATIAQQEPPRPLDEVVGKALSERRKDARRGGFTFTKLTREPQTINGHDAILFGYQWKEPGIGRATAFNYAFNDGGFGWRTRAAVKGESQASIDQAKEIATEMANTFEFR